ncbi:hypothetical protein [Sediminimonas qiaohouensis]|uniref:hypothetical protein n=1 Tax=Sediminimonas qiaohouensis TaxID=552061 RepID=UPI00146CE100|nr:hypothetical protein [Sediminimonas qiaohouensis]
MIGRMFSILSLGAALPGAAMVAGLATVAALAPQSASAERIECPQSKIRREVTTALPSGWWNTPIVNSLTDVRVITIGGKKALQCLYGPAGSIQRYAPEGATCSTSGGAFECETASAGPQTFTTSALDIPQTYTADLDRGSVGAGNAADIWFQAETADLLYVAPRNGARLGVGDRSNRGYAGCSSARFTRDRVSLRDIPVGSYICVRTNEGRISQFRVNGVTGGSPKTLKIGYTTWR